MIENDEGRLDGVYAVGGSAAGRQASSAPTSTTGTGPLNRSTRIAAIVEKPEATASAARWQRHDIDYAEWQQIDDAEKSAALEGAPRRN